MNARLLLCVVVMTGAIAPAAQPPPKPPPKVIREVPPEVLNKIGFPVAKPIHTIVVKPGQQVGAETAPPTQGTAAVVDLSAVRTRVGDVSEIRIARNGASQVAPVAPGNLVTLQRGELLVVQRPNAQAAAVQSDGEAVLASPTIVYTVDPSGQTRELGLVHRSAGLSWKPEEERFAGELLVGLLDRQNPQATGPLGTTIAIQLLAAVPDTLSDVELDINRIGWSQRVQVAVRAPANPFGVEFVSQIDPDFPRAALQVFRPRLVISAADAIQGLGVEEAPVTISGVDFKLPRGQAINLEFDNGWLADRVLIVDDEGRASTRIRSVGLGRGTLRVGTSNIFAAEPREIRYSLPVRFVLATVAGGMLGAMVFVYMLKRAAPRRRRSYAMDWVIGVVVGVGVTTMAYAGMRLPEWMPIPATLAGEVAPFALSFFAAAAATAVLQWISGPAAKPTRE
jgi:hypothetical protein